MQYKKIKTYDYTSGKKDAKIYALIASNKGEVCKILFEPNETIVLLEILLKHLEK